MRGGLGCETDEVRASIVITNHNYGRFLREAIDSAQGQAYDDLELIVVDDGSTDSSREILSSATDVDVVLQENAGQTAAMNAGFQRSSGELVIFLDADDVLEPLAVADAMERFVATSAAKVHWRASEINSEGAATGRTRPAGALPEGALRDTVLSHGPESYETPPTSANAWARSYLEQVMPLPEVERQLRAGSAHADAYLSDLAPFYGVVARVEPTNTRYRVHGHNDYSSLSPLERLRRDARVYEDRMLRLAAFCEQHGHPADLDAWRRASWSHGVLDAVDTVQNTVPADTEFVCIDDQQLPTVFPGHLALPLVAMDGYDAGPPESDAAAVSALAAHRRDGRRFVVVFWPAFWWLDHYVDFARSLDEQYRLVRETPQVKVFQG